MRSKGTGEPEGVHPQHISPLAKVQLSGLPIWTDLGEGVKRADDNTAWIGLGFTTHR
jgi:hypothetical protein